MSEGDVLKSLLREKNVPSNSSWEYAIKLMESDSRFELVRSYPGRKQIFNDYKIQRAKDDKEQFRLKARRAREQLEQFLMSEPRMTSGLRYRQACDLFRDAEQWKAIENEDERRDIFMDTIEMVEKRDRATARQLRQRNISVLRDILDSMPNISAHSTWCDAQRMLLNNEAFAQDAQLLAMDKEDALVVFTEHIQQLELDEEDERRRNKYRKAKIERDNRRAFIEYLDELHETGKLTSQSKWQTLYPEISADARYTAMLNQPMSGSTALDLFKFYVDDLRARYDQEKQIILDILRKGEFDMTLDTTFVEFAQFVSADVRSATLDGGNLKAIFERLLEKEREKDRLRLKQQAKERRKLEHAFISVLVKQFDNELASNVPLDWSVDVRPAICHEDAYQAIGNDEECAAIFKRYVHSLNESCLHHHTKPKKSARTTTNSAIEHQHHQQSTQYL